MKKPVALIIAAIVIFSFFWAYAYAETEADQALYHFAGKVIAVSDTRITVNSKLSRDSSRTVTFMITKATIVHGKITRGSGVHVTYTVGKARKPSRVALVIQLLETTKQKTIPSK